MTAWKAMSMMRDTILYKSKILSLVRSKRKRISNDYQHVFTKPRLWAQYAEAQYGLSLIFSLTAFLDTFQKSYPKLTVYKDYVAYDLSKGDESLKTDMDYDKSLSIEDNIRTHIETRKKDIFFRKYEDFGDENEYRIVLIDWEGNSNQDIYIDIEGIMKGVILGERFHDVYEETVKDIVINKLNASLYKIYYDGSHVVLKKY